MSSRRSARQLIVAVMLGVLVGGGLMAITPAGAQVNQALETNWKKIWKKELKPLANKSYYKKSETDAKYQAKGSYETAGSGYSKAETYSKAEADAKYAGAGSSYTKAETDAKYAVKPQVIRGIFSMRTTAAAAGALVSNQISFGHTLTTPPTAHLIDVGDPVPAGCSGTSAAPSASPGHLCVFVTLNNNGGSPQIYNVGGAANASSPFGAYIGSAAGAAGNVFLYGSWAVGVSTLASGGAGFAPGKAQGAVDGR
ncbi:hypothetical protein EUA93_11775 [Nocardioides oleivorans]|uniref:Uncharacterized protein n=1 Tax=Nocardioides oleivorans TaxID=273676 RepID=A0A4Q2S3G3_9ACTN|nr:hypothetical protein [Nocardioides oleivorans]RYB94964.1 hypothetical protein EUA93_11775 [Nocardioides oleivorans]